MTDTRRHEDGFAWYASDACGDETDFPGEPYPHRCLLLSGHEGNHRSRTLTWGVDESARVPSGEPTPVFDHPTNEEVRSCLDFLLRNVINKETVARALIGLLHGRAQQRQLRRQAANEQPKPRYDRDGLGRRGTRPTEQPTPTPEEIVGILMELNWSRTISNNERVSEIQDAITRLHVAARQGVADGERLDWLCTSGSVTREVGGGGYAVEVGETGEERHGKTLREAIDSAIQRIGGVKAESPAMRQCLDLRYAFALGRCAALHELHYAPDHIKGDNLPLDEPCAECQERGAVCYPLPDEGQEP
jgi:hypothetical protein